MFTNLTEIGVLDTMSKSISFDGSKKESKAQDIIYDMASAIINDYLSMTDDFYHALMMKIDELSSSLEGYDKISEIFETRFSKALIKLRTNVLYDPAYKASSYIVLTEVESSENYKDPRAWIICISQLMGEFGCKFMNAFADEIHLASQDVIEDLAEYRKKEDIRPTLNLASVVIFQFLDKEIEEIRNNAKDIRPNKFFTALANKIDGEE